MRKKAVSPAHRRTLAEQVVQDGLCSQRAACRFLGLARSTYGYRGRAPTAKEEQLRKRLLALSAEASALRVSPDRRAAAPGRLAVGKRQIQRLRRDEGLRVPPTQTQNHSAWFFHWVADDGDASEPCLDLGLHCGCDRAWRVPADADDPG
jgi:hypothetical protein